MSDDWQETKREYDINDKGEYIARHVTMEKSKEKILGFEKKDFWDQLIKSVGIVAIIVPLILFKCSQQADIDKQKTLIQLELFGNISSDVQTILLLPDTSTEFKRSKQKLDIDYYSKMLMLGDNSIVEAYKKLKDTINMYTLTAQINNIQDSIVKHLKIIGDVCTRPDLRASLRDSILKRRSEYLESWAKQWIAHKTRVQSLEKEDRESKSLISLLLDTLNFQLNRYEPIVKEKIQKTPIRPPGLKDIDSMVLGYIRSTGDIDRRLKLQQSNYNTSIDNLFFQLNGKMKTINKILK